MYACVYIVIQVKDPDSVDRLMQCIKQAMPLFSVSVYF